MIPPQRPSAGSGLSELMRAVLNTVPLVVYALAPDGTVMLSEGRALEGMASQPGAAVGRNIREVFAGEPQALPHIERALAGDEHEAEITLDRNGRVYHVWYVPTVDRQGEVRMVTGLALDVTETRRLEAELRDATFWVDQLLAVLPVAVFAIDADSTVRYARGSILAPETAQRVGRPVAEAIPHAPAVVAAVERALRGEAGVVPLHGDDRTFTLLVNPMPGGGAIGVIAELTDALRAEAARLEVARKSRYVNAVTHELRTPLNSVLGFAQLLQRAEFGPLNERQRRYVDNIRSTGDQLLRLIDDLLDLAKAQAGELRINVEQVDADAVAAEVVEQVAPLAGEQGVVLELGAPSRVRVSADRARLVQILLNLVSNAIKFTPRGGRVTVSVHRHRDEAWFRVDDTGVGIALDDQERIFAEFQQVVDTEGRHLKGTGLGLPLSRGLARAMRGDIDVSSRLGRGSTFTLRLPLA